MQNTSMCCSKIICIVGPTGSGKTSISLQLALQHTATIINADSRQLYTDFPIITAQPTATDYSIAPHNLYGYLPTVKKASAGKWVSAAREAVKNAHNIGRLPILVGGTGLYLRALFDGIVSIPQIPNDVVEHVEQAYREEGLTALYNKLTVYDPLYAARIHPNDQQRILRALMVFKSTGKTFTWWHQQTPKPMNVDVLRIGIRQSLSKLTPFLTQRIDTMLSQGAMEEAMKAYAKCPDENAPGWSSIGCAELIGNITGIYSLSQAKELWIKNTRAYAKRQLTWFNADTRIRWFHPEQLEEIFDLVKQWLQ